MQIQSYKETFALSAENIDAFSETLEEILTVVLFVATPPVPGANLLAYTVIFVQLGIPAEALIDAMIFDIIFGLFASTANQAMLQLELVEQADKIGLLNRTLLQKAE